MIIIDIGKFSHFTYSLKRTNSVLQEHEEALQRKKEMVLAKQQQVRQEFLFNFPAEFLHLEFASVSMFTYRSGGSRGGSTPPFWERKGPPSPDSRPFANLNFPPASNLHCRGNHFSFETNFKLDFIDGGRMIFKADLCDSKLYPCSKNITHLSLLIISPRGATSISQHNPWFI